MKYTKLHLGVAIFGLIVTTAIVAGSTYAHNSDRDTEGCSFFQERRQTMQNALESGNYEDLGEDTKISEENFNRLSQAYQENGHDGVREVMQELGLKRHNNRMGLFGHGGPAQQKMKNAIENNDYSALGEDPKISEEDFNKLVEIHALIEAGNYEEAKELKKELGLRMFHR